MKTYTFKVVVEPDEDADGNPAWHAYCPALVSTGAATSGARGMRPSKTLAKSSSLVVESMIEHGEQLPEESKEEVQVTVEPRVTVNV